MSCSGCRVLRKGCSESCMLRPCVNWIETAEAQAHAIVFVAKFFGRAALISFISAVPEDQRPGTYVVIVAFLRVSITCTLIISFSSSLALSFVPYQLYFVRFFTKRVAVRSTRSTELLGCCGQVTGTCARRPSKPFSAAALSNRLRTFPIRWQETGSDPGPGPSPDSMARRSCSRPISISA